MSLMAPITAKPVCWILRYLSCAHTSPLTLLMIGITLRWHRKVSVDDLFRIRVATYLAVRARSVSIIISLLLYRGSQSRKLFFTDYLIYTRGSQDDFDRYAKVSGDQGWSWKQMQQYFKKNERFIPPVDKHNITGQFDPTIHGFTGINSVSLSGFPTPIDGRIINATHQLGGDFTFTPDFNGGNELGVGERGPQLIQP